MNDYIGKTVASVEVQNWAGRDTFKDDVTFERTVITFTDGTTTAFDSWDGEVYDPYLYSDIDEDGHPVPLEDEHEYAEYDTPEILRDHLVEHHGFLPASTRVLFEAGGHHLRTSHRMAHHQDPEGD